MRLRRVAVRLRGLPEELEGLRVAHLSDFHLGVPSRGAHAVERAIEWTVERRPDLVCLTGDLLTHPRGEPRLRAALARLGGGYAVLGNHDVGISRDPFARGAAPFDVAPATLLHDGSVTLELRGRLVQLVGVDPRSYLRGAARPAELVRPDADLRILLSHFPRVIDTLPAGAFDLVLAGHLHDGQITVPIGPRRLRLAHPRFPYPRGLYRRPAAMMHVSPGLGTTFVPFRFFARPEATELVLSR